jgi:glycerophosphoryl diester phosphodiesterase
MASCPENTLASFSRAIRDGADLLETDLHVTSDGVFVCIHDASVDRTTDGTGRIADLTSAETQHLRAGRQLPGFEGEGIPTLEEVCGILEPGVYLALELKSARFREEQVCKKLADALRRLGVWQRTVVIAFRSRHLRAFRSVEAEVPIGQISLSISPHEDRTCSVLSGRSSF